MNEMLDNIVIKFDSVRKKGSTDDVTTRLNLNANKVLTFDGNCFSKVILRLAQISDNYPNEVYFKQNTYDFGRHNSLEW